MDFLRVSAKQYRQMVQGKKENKYHAIKTESDGIDFDSKKEAKKWQELKMLERSGKIKNLERQKRFTLQDRFVNNEKKTIRPIYWFADFYYEKNGIKIVEDTKGVKTEAYKIKKKLFQYKYPEYKFIES